MADPLVDRLIELHKKLEAAREGSAIKGWRPLRFHSNGRVIAGKIVDGTYCTNDFEPVGEWKKAAEYLELENEFRSLLFSDLTPDQIDAYRAGVGLPPATRHKTNAQ
nr:hypothetical protein Josef01_02j05_49 [uncultured archaeon]